MPTLLEPEVRARGGPRISRREQVEPLSERERLEALILRAGYIPYADEAVRAYMDAVSRNESRGRASQWYSVPVAELPQHFTGVGAPPLAQQTMIDTVAGEAARAGEQVIFGAEVYDEDPVIYAQLEGGQARIHFASYKLYPKHAHLLTGGKGGNTPSVSRGLAIWVMSLMLSVL